VINKPPLEERKIKEKEVTPGTTQPSLQEDQYIRI
jgi:hypothetical protein